MISILYGGITHHFINHDLPYCNRINNVGSIHNEYVVALVGDDAVKVGAIAGKDSACGNIVGPVFTININESFDFVFGGYNTNTEKFHKLGMEPPSAMGVTPIVGIDYKLSLYKGDNFELGLDTIVSYGIITHAFRVNF